jgi:hypothetical protein
VPYSPVVLREIAACFNMRVPRVEVATKDREGIVEAGIVEQNICRYT